MYKNTTWTNAYAGQRVAVFIETNRNSIEKDPYSCAIKKKNPNFSVWDTVGHIPREISRHVFYFISAEKGSIAGTVMSTDYRNSPIPSGCQVMLYWPDSPAPIIVLTCGLEIVLV